MTKKYLLAFALLVWIQFGYSQEKEATPFDFGRMWTFENPPIQYFEKEYGLNLDASWFDDVRKSSLRFASWCSASFVSPNGLIMTNHHCSRDVAISVQKDNENFDNYGFYAEKMNEERKVEGLFVEQLIQVADITQMVKDKIASAQSDEERIAMTEEALNSIQNEYSTKKDWMGLRLQTVTYYSGGKFSLYGYKKYDDIRLVLIPENDLGFYGGDPDNFTYPRYNLDFTFWRAYDQNGKPLNTADNYYEFNPDGIEDNIPVFVVGNPGSTERYRTVAQLSYDRDHRFKYLLRWLTNRRDMMQAEYDMISKQPENQRSAQELLGTINNLSNSIKAYNGIMKGLHNEHFMNRKQQIEDQMISQSPGISYWSELEQEYEKLNPHSWAISYLAPSPLRGKVLLLMHQLSALKAAISSENSKEEDILPLKANIQATLEGFDTKKEKELFKVLLEEIKMDIYTGDNTLRRVLDGKNIDGFIDELFKKSKVLKSKEDAEECLSKDKNITKSKDMLIKVADIMVTRYNDASDAFGGSAAKRRTLESKIANQAFKVFGNSLPPDATFTLRISDGRVKAYEYNGTVAPINTTFFGLYDRHYSHKQTFPWALPEKWNNPPMELLKSPLNLVSTNDIIGGNSGSALINAKGEAVGLIFDGNIESLPGNFIYDDEHNRTVSVHAGGIHAALKYIYQAKRLLKELEN